MWTVDNPWRIVCDGHPVPPSSWSRSQNPAHPGQGRRTPLTLVKVAAHPSPWVHGFYIWKFGVFGSFFPLARACVRACVRASPTPRRTPLRRLFYFFSEIKLVFFFSCGKTSTALMKGTLTFTQTAPNELRVLDRPLKLLHVVPTQIRGRGLFELVLCSVIFCFFYEGQS